MLGRLPLFATCHSYRCHGADRLVCRSSSPPGLRQVGAVFGTTETRRLDRRGQLGVRAVRRETVREVLLRVFDQIRRVRRPSWLRGRLCSARWVSKQLATQVQNNSHGKKTHPTSCR